METNQLEREIESIDNKIQELHRKRHDLIKKRENVFNERMKKLIGICFIKEENYYLITDIPKPPNTLIPQSANFYRIPVFVLNKEEREFYQDTLFSRACEADEPITILNHEIDRFISKEKFKEEAIKIISEVINNKKMKKND